jgi:hypothetical protein
MKGDTDSKRQDERASKREKTRVSHILRHVERKPSSPALKEREKMLVKKERTLVRNKDRVDKYLPDIDEV